MDDNYQDLRHALSLMQTALSLLDRAEISAEIAGHLDLAICRLQQLIETADEPQPFRR